MTELYRQLPRGTGRDRDEDWTEASKAPEHSTPEHDVDLFCISQSLTRTRSASTLNRAPAVEGLKMCPAAYRARRATARNGSWGNKP
jgi:hypothetical protein